MKIPAQTIFRQKAVIAKNNDPATTQVSQETVQAQERKRPKREGSVLGTFLGSLLIFGALEVLGEGFYKLISKITGF